MPIGLSKTRSECGRCHTEFTEDDIVYDQTGFDPPEFTGHCPECGSTNIKHYSTAYCRTCEDVEVADEGEQCAECRTTQLEAQADALDDR